MGSLGSYREGDRWWCLLSEGAPHCIQHFNVFAIFDTCSFFLVLLPGCSSFPTALFWISAGEQRPGIYSVIGAMGASSGQKAQAHVISKRPRTLNYQVVGEFKRTRLNKCETQVQRFLSKFITHDALQPNSRAYNRLLKEWSWVDFSLPFQYILVRGILFLFCVLKTHKYTKHHILGFKLFSRN